jgi:hypothetical protein
MSEGRLLITRFGPWSPEKCDETARDQYNDDLRNGRNPPRFGISVFGDHLRAGENIADVVQRICAGVPVGGKKVAVIWADELEALGWEVHPDMPPDLHYLVGQDDLMQVPNVELLALLWAKHKIDNPAWRRR